MSPKQVVMLSPHAITPGQVLGRDVRDGEGTLLAVTGRVLDQPLLERLRQANVSTVPVVASPDSMVFAIRKAYMEASLNHLFRHWRFSPGMRRLRSMLLEYRTGSSS